MSGWGTIASGFAATLAFTARLGRRAGDDPQITTAIAVPNTVQTSAVAAPGTK